MKDGTSAIDQDDIFSDDDLPVMVLTLVILLILQ